MAKIKQQDVIKVQLTKEGIDFIKSQKKIYTQIGALLNQDSDTIKRWVRENYGKRLTAADTIMAIRQVTGVDISKYIEFV